MPSPRVVIDSDVLIGIMRREPVVTERSRQYLAEHGSFCLSIITQYEVLRGLRIKEAEKQIQQFEALCSRSVILPLTPESVRKAAEIYAAVRQQGQLIGDADILIAASALSAGIGMVTNNEQHFRRIEGLHVESWLE